MIPYNIDTLPVTILFCINAGLWFYYGLQLHKVYETHNFLNTCCTVALWVVAGLCYPFFYLNDTPQVHFFQLLSNLFVVGLTPVLLFLIVLYQKRVVAQKPQLKEKRTFDHLLQSYGIDKETLGKKEYDGGKAEGRHYTIKIDLKRKLLHFVPALAIIGLWLFATRLWAATWALDQVWQISGEDFGYFLILTIGYSGIFAFAVLEYLRFSYLFPKWNAYYLLPNNVLRLLCRAMKPREFTEFIKPVPLILAMVPGSFLPFSLFASVALVATSADGAASVAGKAFGKHHWPKDSPKTVEGYIAGGLTTFGISFGIIALLGSFAMPEILLYACVNTGIFLAIDIINPPIDDNILNPILCAVGLALVFFF